MSLQRRSLACLLLAVSACEAEHGGLRASSSTATLQPWLIGLAAVVGFLFLVFVLLIIKRVFFKTDEPEGAGERRKSGQDNPALEVEVSEAKDSSQTSF
ncbi:small integral membrane protein 24 [Lepisosteus oculatus]|uniref:small integral membrane protein 24 n=1 Tax=Lepisosteus oculatus TaxID=7918 RepID=UPI00074038E4|nr:PREDICTED: small integral membrane protein 24 [Lepisosteus oculatus]